MLFSGSKESRRTTSRLQDSTTGWILSSPYGYHSTCQVGQQTLEYSRMDQTVACLLPPYPLDARTWIGMVLQEINC